LTDSRPHIRLGWPDLGEPELAEVAEVLESGMLTMGPKVELDDGLERTITWYRESAPR
jgi:dTDP-4-amino-4,6-dideoxygalactose transaminase